MTDTERSDLARIREALEAAREAVRPFSPGEVDYDLKSSRGDPVTEADHAIDAVLRRILPGAGEGWLSEETADSGARLATRRVWIVDPLDGTREFVDGIPEWCISVGLVEDGAPVAGGIVNPATGDVVLGSRSTGVTLNGEPVEVEWMDALDGATVLASRTEVGRGEWERFADAPFEVRPCGSVAFKLGLVASGRADATWTLVPKHEWDVAAGVALVLAAGGTACLPDGSVPTFNRRHPKLPGLLAGAPGAIREFRHRHLSAPVDVRTETR